MKKSLFMLKRERQLKIIDKVRDNPTIIKEGIIPADENEIIAKAATIDSFKM
ncbi:MAG: hypothetical protein JJE44_01750 [Flavobacteriaceae bacterium]|nr:hypothetical protein [Flavobacteriaceae bacterium]